MSTALVYLNGKILPAEQACISVFDHGFLYGDGVYETLNWHDDAVHNFTAHDARLRASAAQLRLTVPLATAELCAVTTELAQLSGLSVARLRITVTRGVNGFVFAEPTQPTLLITIAPLADYSQQQRDGVRVITTPRVARPLPTCKHISLVAMAYAKQLASAAGAFETIFCDPDDGALLEGSVSNLSYLRDGVLTLAPVERVLAGTTQQQLIDTVVPVLGWQVRHAASIATEVCAADAVFISNALFGVLAVREIDGVAIADGREVAAEIAAILHQKI